MTESEEEEEVEKVEESDSSESERRTAKSMQKQVKLPHIQNSSRTEARMADRRQPIDFDRPKLPSVYRRKRFSIDNGYSSVY